MTIKEEILSQYESIKHESGSCVYYENVFMAMDEYANFKTEDLKRYVRHLEFQISVDKDRENDVLAKRYIDLVNKLIEAQKQPTINEQLNKFYIITSNL